MKIEDFYHYLENNPEDWDYHGVFADWLFENNHPLEKTHRYLFKNKKNPVFIGKSINYYCWGSEEAVNEYYFKKLSRLLLPKKIFKKLLSYKQDSDSLWWKYYDSLQEACSSLNEVL